MFYSMMLHKKKWFSSSSVAIEFVIMFTERRLDLRLLHDIEITVVIITASN
jgi:hypothetical protein